MTEAGGESDRQGGMFADLAAATAFLTLLPLPRRWAGAAGRPLDRACRCYPLVGGILGLLAGLVLLVLQGLGVPGTVAALAAVLALVLLTGGRRAGGRATSRGSRHPAGFGSGAGIVRRCLKDGRLE